MKVGVAAIVGIVTVSLAVGQALAWGADMPSATPEGPKPAAEALGAEAPASNAPLAERQLTVDLYGNIGAGYSSAIVLPEVGQGTSASAGLYDPVSGYFYYPGARPGTVTITIGGSNGPQVTYYLIAGPSGPMPLQYYAALADRLRSLKPDAGSARAEPAAPLPRAEKGETQGAVPRAHSNFRSRLSPMLGGPRDVSLAFALGEAKLQEGRFSEAEAAFRRTVAVTPDVAAPRLALALALVGEGQYAAAADELRAGLLVVSDWSAIKLDAAFAFGSPDAYRTLEGKLASQAHAETANGDAQLLLGFHYFAAGDEAQAVKVLQPAAGANPGDAAIKDLLAAARAQRG